MKTILLKILSVAPIILLLIASACTFEPSSKKMNDKMNPVVTDSFLAIDSLLNSYVQNGRIQGAVGLVSIEGELVYHNALGYSNIQDSKAQTLDDIFRIASMTKPITSVGAMILYDEGKFDLDDPVGEYIPEFKELEILDRIIYSDSSYTSHPAEKKMTIRHLFTHSSGSYYAYDNDTLVTLYAKNGITEGFEERDILLADNIRKLGDLPILHEPGERFTYGLSMDILGRLIEIWSGQTLDKFLKERLFDPLGMEDTYFYLPENKYDRLAPVYKSTETGVQPTDYPLVDYPVRGAKKYLSGGGDLNCTAYDYYLFCQMMLNRGELKGTKVLKPETVDLITTTHFERGDDDMGLGIGLLSEKTYTKSARSVGSYSWGGFFTTTFWVDPVEDLVAILMLQVYPFEDWDIQTHFENIIYKIIKD